MTPSRFFGGSRSRPSPSSRCFDLDRHLISFNSGRDGISWRDAFGGGVLCMSDSGGGKSSGALALIGRSALAQGASLAVTTVKPSDTEYWSRIAALSKRSVRIVRIGSDTFNPIAHAQFSAHSCGTHVENLVSLLSIPMRRQHQGGGGDRFFLGDAERYVRAICTLFVLARMPLSFKVVTESLLRLPQNLREVFDPRWRESNPAFRALIEAEKHVATPADRADLVAAAEFLVKTAPQMPSRTRASTVATFVSAVDSYLHGAAGRMLNADTNTWDPRECLERPQVVIFDAPTQVWGAIGATIQRILVTSLQRAVLTRDLSKGSFPVVLMMDEYQELCDPIDDPVFMRTGRSRHSCMVVGTQSVANIRSACGGAPEPRASADAILGLPGVKMFGCLTCPESAQWASSVFAQTRQPRVTISSPEQGGGDKQKKRGDAHAQVSFEWSSDCPPIELARLAKGGPPNFIVENFVHAGRMWSNGRPSFKLAIPQTRFD